MGTIERQARLQELYQWSKTKSRLGIQTKLRTKAIREYGVSQATALNYAETVTMMLEDSKTEDRIIASMMAAIGATETR